MSSEWSLEQLTHSSVMGVDPDVEWALKEGWDYLFPAEGLQWMPVVVEFKPESSLSYEDFDDGKRIAPEHLEIWKSSVRALRLHVLANSSERPMRLCTALVTREFFRLIWNEEKVRENYEKHVSSVTLALPLDEDSLPARGETP